MKSLFALMCLSTFLIVAGENLADALKLIDAKNYDGARKTLEEIISRDGSNAEARFHLGTLLADHFRRYDDAEEQLEKAVEFADSNAEYHFCLGVFYGGQAQRAGLFSRMSFAGKVKNQFLRAVELDPRSARYRSALISYYLQAPGIAGGSVSKAREQGIELLRYDSFEGHMALAGVAEYEKEFGTAEQEYISAAKANSSSWRPYHRLGYLYIRLKRVDDAIEQFTRYVQCAPRDANSYDSLADGYTAKGETDAALSNYLKALTINPTFPSSLYGAARCYDELGKKRDAMQYYKKFLDGDPAGENASKAKKRAVELEGS